MTKFKLKLADRVVNIESRFDSLLKFCEKFLYDGNEEDFAVSVTDEQIGVYKKMNQELWEMLERGEITKPELAPERFRRFLVYMG